MSNIFSNLINNVKAVPEILKAKAKAGEAEIQARRVAQIKGAKPAPTAPTGNVFQDIIDRLPKAPDFVTEKSFAPARELGKEIRQRVGEPLSKGVEVARKKTVETTLNVFSGISKGAAAITTGESKKPEESFKEYYERLPYFSDVVTGKVRQVPIIGKIPGVAPVAGFLSEILLPPYGLGTEAKLAKKLAQETAEDIIKDTLKTAIKDVSEEEAGILAKKLAPITDEKIVQQELENFAKAKMAVKPAVPTTKLIRKVEEIRPPKAEARPVAKIEPVPRPANVFEGIKEAVGRDRVDKLPSLEQKVLDLKREISSTTGERRDYLVGEINSVLKERNIIRSDMRSLEKRLAGQGDLYSPSARRTASIFESSGGQQRIGKTNYQLGDFGRSSQSRKLEMKGDRFPENQLEETLRNTRLVRRASPNPTVHRFDNVAHVAVMPNGEVRVIYTRLNKTGAEEVVNWHTISNKRYLDSLLSFGIPDGNRTRNLLVRTESLNPLSFRDNLTVNRMPQKVNPPPPVEGNLPRVPEKPRGPERKFGTAVRESPESKPELKTELQKRDLTYARLRNKEIIDKAKARIAESPTGAENYVRQGAEADAEQVATSIELIRHYQSTKSYAKAADVAETIAEKLTHAGQSIQAAKLYTHLAPEAITIRAQKLINKLNAKRFRWQKDIKLGEETVKQITELATNMKNAADPAIKIEFSEELESILRNIPRSGVLRKISMMQTLAQLLNPKTILVRNPLGNEIFYRLERLNKYVSSPIDWARSKLTGGERTITFRTVNQGEFWKNWLVGAKAGWKGITPGGLGTQFEIYAPAFKEKWNPLTYLEKSLGVSLRSFDYASYKRAVNQTTGELGWLRAYNEELRGQALKDAAKRYATEVSDESLKIADEYGKYVTFQDNNAISRMLMATKRGLNLGQEFGIGDLVLKYPKTPGALMMRGLEYSPAGFLRSLYLIGKPLLKAHVKADVREIELSLARAVTGTLGLTGLGYYLADKGIITGQPDPNKKVSGLERAIGAGKYQINVGALKRWAQSGFVDVSLSEGDRFYTYDWAQPVAIALSLGANMNESQQESEQKRGRLGALAGVPGTLESSISGAVETITEQPLLTGIRNLFGGESPVESALRVVESMPSSFTPTIVNQFRQIVDPVSRETWDPSLLKRSINRVKTRIPDLSEELPKRRDVFGREVPVMENPNLFNIFINPGFLSTYNPTPAAQLVLEIYNAIGETKQLPKVAPKYLVFQGKRVDLSGDQLSSFQEKIGKATDVIFTRLATNSKFQSAPNDKKADMLSYALGKLYNVEKFLILTPEQRKFLVESMSPEEKKSFAKELKSAL